MLKWYTVHWYMHDSLVCIQAQSDSKAIALVARFMHMQETQLIAILVNAKISRRIIPS